MEMIVSDYISLKDVADVIAGQILTRVTSKNDFGKTVRVLVPKAVVSGVIVKKDLGEAVLERDVDSKKYTLEGDVVIKLSSPYDAAYITAEEKGLLLPSFCAVIRVRKNDELDAKYLSAFLNSSYATRYMRTAESGAAMPMIRIGALRDLQIPRVPIQDMRAIGKAYMLSGRKKEILREMIRTENSLMENIVLANIRKETGNV